MNRTQVEKYRPSLICDIVGNRDAVSRLQVIADVGNMPNMLFSVPPPPPPPRVPTPGRPRRPIACLPTLKRGDVLVVLKFFSFEVRGLN